MVLFVLCILQGVYMSGVRPPQLAADQGGAAAAVVQILLETLYRVAGNAAENEMDARALALSVAPCLAWHAPPGSDRRRVRTRSGHSSQSASGDIHHNVHACYFVVLLRVWFL